MVLKKLNQQLNKILGKNLSVNALRHAYLTYKYPGRIDDNQELKDVMQLITNALLVSTDDFLKQNYDTKYQNWETNDKI